jgi:hypothetical protein
MVRQLPAPSDAHTHKVQVADGLLLVNHEAYPYGKPAVRGSFRPGFAVHSLADPYDPQPIGFWECGGRGVHRMVFTGGRFVYLSFTPDGHRSRIWGIVDIGDPTNPVEVSRWTWDDMPDASVAAQKTDRHGAHHALLAGTTAYLGHGDGNLVVLDVADPRTPRFVGHCSWGGGDTHTCLPIAGRTVLAVTDEQIRRGGPPDERRIRLVDISDPREPNVLAVVVAPSDGVAHPDLRYGPHNLHENQPGAYQSDVLIFATYFSAGLRVYDVTNPRRPAEIAHWIAGGLEPGPQANDVFVRDDCTIAVSDRIGGGVALLRPSVPLHDVMQQSRRTDIDPR